MNNSFNSITFVGYLTRNAESKSFASGKTAYTLGLATTKKFRNKQTNEIKEEVCFVDAVTWSTNLPIQQLTKDSRVLVQGYLKLDRWEDKEGNKFSKHRIYAETVVPLGSSSQEPKAPTQEEEHFDLPF